MLSRLITTLGLSGSVSCRPPCRRTAKSSSSCTLRKGARPCPPANAYLNELSKDRRDVLPLAFHVTYWDRLGWKDPYSLQALRIARDQYGHRFGDGSYTPEIVVMAPPDLSARIAMMSVQLSKRRKRESRTAASISVTKTEGAGFHPGRLRQRHRQDPSHRL